ncbi:GNAT family N-acetyltransferase [Blastopirellula retiformator]|uniref:N-acetyltransferase domain-containing protein n=1 Tax=Blastopirellula retiformator TaxID=2527970 RepID=A0A5C5UYF5_9BACT|nr:GNAT family N-acetyltransferase [Blastopirellula retiformator]TWT31374.1 hypothetical protein Enr8_32950 [Blastopirellula retiformator]
MEFRFLSPDQSTRLRNLPDDLLGGSLDLEQLERFLADSRNQLCVCFVEGIAIGYAAGVHLTHLDRPDELFLAGIEVTSAWRDAGVAEELLLRMRIKASELDCVSVSAVADRKDAASIVLFSSVPDVRAYDLVEFSFPLTDLAEPPLPTAPNRPPEIHPLPHPAPVKALNFLLQLHRGEKSGQPPGEKLAQQIAAEFLPEDEMEVTLSNWRDLGWSWTFTIGERTYEGVVAILADPSQALLQIGPLERMTFFGIQSKLSPEDMAPIQERTEAAIEKLPELARFQFSTEGFPDAEVAPSQKALERAMKKWEESQETGLQRPVDAELTLLQRFFLAPLRSKRKGEAEPIRKIDLRYLGIMLGITAIGKIYLDYHFPWFEQLWIAPAVALVIGALFAGARKRPAWIGVSFLVTGTIYVALLFFRALIRPF